MRTWTTLTLPAKRWWNLTSDTKDALDIHDDERQAFDPDAFHLAATDTVKTGVVRVLNTLWPRRTSGPIKCSTVQEVLREAGFDLQLWDRELTQVVQSRRLRSEFGSHVGSLRSRELLQAARLQVECGWDARVGANDQGGSLLAAARRAVAFGDFTPGAITSALEVIRGGNRHRHVVLHSFAFIPPLAGRLIEALAGGRVTRVTVVVEPDRGIDAPALPAPKSFVSLAELLANVHPTADTKVCMAMPRDVVADVESAYFGASHSRERMTLRVLADIAANGSAWTVREDHVARWLDQTSPDGAAIFAELAGFFEGCASTGEWRTRLDRLMHTLEADISVPHHPVGAHRHAHVGLVVEGALRTLLADVDAFGGMVTIRQVLQHERVGAFPGMLSELERQGHADTSCDAGAVAGLLRAVAASYGPSPDDRRIQPWGWLFEMPYRDRPQDLHIACLDEDRFPGRPWQVPWPLELSRCPDDLARRCIVERIARHGEVARRVLGVAGEACTGTITLSWCEEMQGRCLGPTPVLAVSNSAPTSERAAWPTSARPPRIVAPEWVHAGAEASRRRIMRSKARRNPVPTGSGAHEPREWYRRLERGAWNVCPRLGALNAVRGQSLVYRERLHRYRLLTRIQAMGVRNILGEGWKEMFSEALEPGWPEAQRIGVISDGPATVREVPGRQYFVHRELALRASDESARATESSRGAPATPGPWCTWCPERQGCAHAHPPRSIDDRARSKDEEKYSAEADVDDTNGGQGQ